MKPKHKVITRSPQRTVGLVACTWLQAHPVEYESQLERRFILRMLLTAGVISIVDQPFKISHGDNGEYTYTPDFLISFANGQKIVVEIKPEKFIPQFAELFDNVTLILREKGLTFFVVSEYTIDVGDLSDEIELMLRYARGDMPEKSIVAVKNEFKNAPDNASLESIATAAGADISVIHHMVGRQILVTKNELTSEMPKFKSQYILKEDYVNLCIPNWFNAEAWGKKVRIRSDARKQSSAIRGFADTPKLCVVHR
jgi:hypothetical protein